MKRIAAALWDEPVLAGTVLNTALVVLAAENVLSGWVPAVAIAVSGVVIRHFTIPERKLTRALETPDRYEGSN
jgi:hypothetical protein